MNIKKIFVCACQNSVYQGNYFLWNMLFMAVVHFVLHLKNWFSDYLLHCCCSVVQPCLTLCDPMDCRTPGFPALHYVLEFAQICVH